MTSGNGGKRITTSQLLTKINNAKSFEEAIAYHDKADEPTLSAMLYDMMSARSLNPKDMIALTGIDRSYFYHILSGEKHPGRNMVLRICFALRASVTDTNRLLRLAGLSELYPRIRRDAIIIYALQRKNTASQANELLNQQSEEPLYQEDGHG